MRDTWDEMIRELVAFNKKNGHCNVPTSGEKNPRLGRWVAAQRYKGRVGELPAPRLAELNAVGFIWSPSDMAWQTMFAKLTKFRKTSGNCNVPERWPQDQGLASWVQRQRINHRRGKLTSERVRLLEQIGFRWAIYKAEKQDEDEQSQAAAKTGIPKAPEREREKLYCLGHGDYVQYSGTGTEPRELKEFVQAHRGSYPPYIPLPHGKTLFFLGDRYAPGSKKIAWRGAGPLPPEILRYVKRHGVLPAHD